MTRKAARADGRASIRRRCAAMGAAAAMAVICPGVLSAATAAAGTRTVATGRMASGAIWGTAEEVPGLAALNTGGDAAIVSVSCAAPGDCGAGGFFSDNAGRQAFVAIQADRTWGTAQEVPGLAALNTGGDAEVNSVSCAAPGQCSAGGQYTSGTYPHGRGQAFVVSETNGTWGTAETVGAALNKGGFARILSVSCASAGNCSAGGGYRQASGGYQAFVISEKNGTWGTAEKVPGLAALNTRPEAEVDSVSCASPGNCTAGGSYGRRLSAGGFVVSETNGRWSTAEKVPGIAVRQGEYDNIGSVSCGSAGNCAAGGSFETSSNSGPQAFVVSETNGRWGTAKPVAVGVVESVSCAAAGNCSAVGSHLGVPRTGFAVNQKNGTWGTAEELSGTAGGKRGSADNLSVSCATPGNCSAGGRTGVAFHQHAFVVSETNGSWGTAQLVPGLAALNQGKFAAVTSMSCAAAGNCSAGGYYSVAFNEQAFVVTETNNTRQ